MMPMLSPDAPEEEQDERVSSEMGKFKKGKMPMGSKKGKIVKSRKQAIAIALSEAGKSNRQKTPSLKR